MKLDDVAKKLADTERIGLTPELVEKLGIVSEDATRGRLMAQLEGDYAHLGVYLLAVFVVDDTDFWGDGEIYWWSIPAMLDAKGKVHKSALYGLPTGMEPHKTGSMEWMTNISIKDPPLLAMIPPNEEVAQCVLRLAIYDDDKRPANVPEAITAGLSAYAGVAEGLDGANNVLLPVRDAIFQSLAAEDDDILIDQEVTFRTGDAVRFGRGMIGSLVNAMARAYYVVKDEQRTETFGPVLLHKGQQEQVRFDSPMKAGGRLALFARGAPIRCATFGNLENELPFINKIVEQRHESALANGFDVAADGPSKLVAYYTPPRD